MGETDPRIISAIHSMFASAFAASKPKSTSTVPANQKVSEVDEKGDTDPLGTLFNQEAERMKREQEEALRTQKVASRDSLLAERLNFEEGAIDYVNSQIAQEKSNADLFGIDYKMDDEIKQNRINDYFATMWTAEQDDKLEKLLASYGNPEGFEGFTTKRGTDGSPKRKMYSKTTVSRSRGMTAPEEFENILTGRMPLGGLDSILGA